MPICAYTQSQTHPFLTHTHTNMNKIATQIHRLAYLSTHFYTLHIIISRSCCHWLILKRDKLKTTMEWTVGKTKSTDNYDDHTCLQRFYFQEDSITLPTNCQESQHRLTKIEWTTSCEYDNRPDHDDDRDKDDDLSWRLQKDNQTTPFPFLSSVDDVGRCGKPFDNALLQQTSFSSSSSSWSSSS